MSIAFQQRLAQGDPLFGTLVSISSPSVAEMLSGLGYDWLFIDGEHAPLSIGEIQRILQAAQPGCPCLVRLPANEARYIKQILDIGADGIIAPLVNTPAEAEMIVRTASYPPQGTRSVGIGRAHRYGSAFESYVRSANDGVTVVVQVEHTEAVTNIDRILKVEGIDAVFIGPYDMSASIGKIGQVQDPEVQSLILKARDACLAAGKPLGILAMDAESARAYATQGYSLIAVSTDYLMLANSASGILDSLSSESRLASS